MIDTTAQLVTVADVDRAREQWTARLAELQGQADQARAEVARNEHERSALLVAAIGGRDAGAAKKLQELDAWRADAMRAAQDIETVCEHIGYELRQLEVRRQLLYRVEVRQLNAADGEQQQKRAKKIDALHAELATVVGEYVACAIAQHERAASANLPEAAALFNPAAFREMLIFAGTRGLGHRFARISNSAWHQSFVEYTRSMPSGRTAPPVPAPSEQSSPLLEYPVAPAAEEGDHGTIH